MPRNATLRIFHTALSVLALVPALAVPAPAAQIRDAAKPYQVEWVYRIKYGHQDEWWRIFQKYDIAELDQEKKLGYIRDYIVVKPGLHTSEDSRWDYRIVITYADLGASTHEAEVTKALFADDAVRKTQEDRRWELTENHWDLPIHEVDPHAPAP